MDHIEERDTPKMMSKYSEEMMQMSEKITPKGDKSEMAKKMSMEMKEHMKEMPESEKMMAKMPSNIMEHNNSTEMHH